LIRPTNIKTPFLFCHGTDDQVVSYKWGKMSYEFLKSLGWNVTLKSYPGLGHGSQDVELRDVAQFLSDCLSK